MVPPGKSYSPTHSGSGRCSGSGSGTPRRSNGFYCGGASVPLPRRSRFTIRPFCIPPLAFWMPICWGPYGAFYYRINDTVPALPNNTAHNATDPVLCICENYHPCGCDNLNGAYHFPVRPRYAGLNGTEYAIVNGTLENGQPDLKAPLVECVLACI